MALVTLMSAITATYLVHAASAKAASSPSGTVYYVSPTGADANNGAESAPWRTVAHGLASLKPGDTLYLMGGTYVENVTSTAIRPATPDAPITVANYPGQRPVIQGLLWLANPSYWTLNGINVTWNPANGSTNHMVKMTNGAGWTIENSELWGAHSYADLLVAGTTSGYPTNWKVANNCIHDTYASNQTNQDHLVYVNTGLTAGAGTIEHNILFNATNGEAVKLGGASSTSGGTANVLVRYNTMYNAAQSMLVAWQSTANTISGNIMGLVGTGYGNIRGYQLNGANNVATGNVGYLASKLILNDAGYVGVADGGANKFPVDPGFDSTTSCAGFHPSNPATTDFGAYAGVPVPDTTPPSVPAGLAGSALGETTVNLSWSASTDNVGVAGYTVYRNGTKVGSVGASATSYTDSGVSPAVTYSYAVDAFDAAGNHSATSQPVSVTPPDLTPPSVPDGVVAEETGIGQAHVSWNASSDNVGVAGYTIYRNGVKLATVSASTTSYTDTSASLLILYTSSYTVDAFDAAGNRSQQSDAATVPVLGLVR